MPGNGKYSISVHFMAAIVLVMTPVFVYGIIIIALQAYVWLKLGEWPQVSMLTLLGADNSEFPVELSKRLPRYDPNSAVVQWLLHPSSWLGVHRVVFPVLSYLGVGYTLTIGVFFSLFGIVFAFSVLDEMANTKNGKR